MISTRVMCVVALTAAAGLGGCQSASRAMGVAKVTPDEFRVVTKAPLVLPPEYALRPPAPGEPRPQELQPESAARAALAGQAAAAQRSDGERLLAARSGAEKSDPLIRYVVDDEFGDIAHKDKSFADRVMFWRKDSPAAPAPSADGAAAPVVVDAAAEEARLKALTGGKTVIIAREKGSWVKLPGL
ncbi:DUF3035 domain-containing protein [Brevundimonas sp. UBA2416]|uniref:DUF3035 domain-containing protein n=1 Tax=Brevundimonas sp. UBA2416 TaxID=1946124 RepID=UPI0025C13502|nr:DUF3035 domain-containing protein [Brevundimonas sp. UBA2416]